MYFYLKTFLIFNRQFENKLWFRSLNLFNFYLKRNSILNSRGMLQSFLAASLLNCTFWYFLINYSFSFAQKISFEVYLSAYQPTRIALMT